MEDKTAPQEVGHLSSINLIALHTILIQLEETGRVTHLQAIKILDTAGMRQTPRKVDDNGVSEWIDDTGCIYGLPLSLTNQKK